MIESPTPPHISAGGHAELDLLLRETLPEIKLALGQLIDRENARALPPRFARLLPETLLVVALRPDAADVLTPLAPQLEQELTDSCTRHGSLYERGYHVQLRRAEDPAAPLFAVAAHAGRELAEPPDEEEDGDDDAAATIAHSDNAPVRDDRAPAAPAPLPVSDPDATQLDWAGPSGWEPGHWVLIVEDEEGEEHEVFRITEPLTVVGRRSDDPQLRAHISISDVPHVSRRQLAIVWEPHDGEEGFQIYNLGLNPLHIGEEEIAGAKLGKQKLRLDGLGDEHSAWVGAGATVRIGEQGPTLRIRQVPDADEAPADPDATVYE